MMSFMICVISMEYISDNYMDITDIGSIAALFNFSRSHFTVRFKKATGITPYDYLTKCRISAAKQLLTNTNRSIEYVHLKAKRVYPLLRIKDWFYILIKTLYCNKNKVLPNAKA